MQFELIKLAEGIIDSHNDSEWIDTLKTRLINNKTLITKESYAWAYNWSLYFNKAVEYIHRKYKNPDRCFDEKVEACINILKSKPNGLTQSNLRRGIGLHRKKRTKAIIL